jgi:L-fuculose-phosphate aldolase
VVHTHAPYATTLACLRRGIPSFHYEVAFAGGDDIRCADYATFGTQELSDFTLAALEGRRACLLANHGAVAFGVSLEDAAGLMEKVEALSRLYWQALQVAEPPRLDRAEMARVLEKFSDYGRG